MKKIKYIRKEKIFLNVKLSQPDLILTAQAGTTSADLRSLGGKVCMMGNFRWLTFNCFRSWAGDINE